MSTQVCVLICVASICFTMIILVLEHGLRRERNNMNTRFTSILGASVVALHNAGLRRITIGIEEAVELDVFVAKDVLSHPEARNLASAILTLVDGESPVAAKETGKAGIPDGDWVDRAADEFAANCIYAWTAAGLKTCIRKHLHLSQVTPPATASKMMNDEIKGQLLADDGVKAAVEELSRYHQPTEANLQYVIAKHCVGREVRDEVRHQLTVDYHRANARYSAAEKSRATEKARADNLQAELDSTLEKIEGLAVQIVNAAQ